MAIKLQVLAERCFGKWERESGENEVIPSGTLCREVFHSFRLSSVKTLWAVLYDGIISGTTVGVLCQDLCGDGRAHSPWLL